MPLKYKEPRTWEKTKALAYPHFGNWEKDAFKMLIDKIPYGCEVKITVQWSRSQHQKRSDDLEKEFAKMKQPKSLES